MSMFIYVVTFLAGASVIFLIAGVTMAKWRGDLPSRGVLRERHLSMEDAKELAILRAENKRLIAELESLKKQDRLPVIEPDSSDPTPPE